MTTPLESHKSTSLIERLHDEADLCRAETATDIAEAALGQGGEN